MLDLPPPLPTQEQVMTALVDCGLDRAGLAVTYEDDLESDVVRIKVAARANDGQFACIHSATAADIVEFEDAGQQEAFTAYVNAALRPEMLASARQSLARAGKLDGLPQFGQFASAQAFFRALESHCGWKSGHAFVEITPGSWTLTPEAIDNHPDFAATGCLFMAMMAQDEDVSAKGVHFGFVGNEAFSDK